ncbi:hypothetical protein C7S18_12310 [Ahniella affigens]|uniref:Uncharacterized protein n=1 Tax=Ahniella affigens TaxID=2021234 RepID=A0A2P1PSV5_9GAMM|nr:hypothetical protein [Ahniella affigens]AVP97935.1 hypothetical protein C7S18_12310 [Ahniella affigens]
MIVSGNTVIGRRIAAASIRKIAEFGQLQPPEWTQLLVFILGNCGTDWTSAGHIVVAGRHVVAEALLFEVMHRSMQNRGYSKPRVLASLKIYFEPYQAAPSWECAIEYARDALNELVMRPSGAVIASFIANAQGAT